MRPPFPSAAQAYAESIDSATASRHHPNARLTILPLPSLAALYPMEHHNTLDASSHDRRSSTSSSSSPSNTSDQTYRRPALHHQQQPSYQSYDTRYQKNPSSSSSSSSSIIPAPAVHNTASTSDTESQSQSQSKPADHEYLGTNMESLLNAIEVHPTLYAHSEASRRSSTPFSTSSPTLSSTPTSPYNLSPMTFGSASPSPTAATLEYSNHSHKCTRASTSPCRMSISHLVDDIPYRDGAACEPTLEDNRPRLKPMVPRATSPLFEDSHKRKWSSDSIDDDRNSKIRLSIQDHVAAKALESFNMGSVSAGLSIVARSSEPTFSTRPQMTTITCYHASVAQKSYGAEKRFLCPPPTVHIDAPFDESFFGLSNRPQVAMSVICEAGENSLGQRSILEDDRSCAFRFLYVSGTAKAKSFQLKLEIYGRACLPNGFLSPDDHTADAEAPEPFAVFESAPVAIISKPSKKTAKARNVSSCILAGSLVSLFNRINSQTVRTKYMSVDGDSLCAKSATWSAFTISIVSNGPSSPPARGSQKSHHRQQAQPTATPITYGAEIVLTESATGIQSDRLVVCKVENGRILEGAVGPICQMQKVALKSLERSTESEPVYLGALGEEHQGGRFLDHGVSTTTTLKYQPSQMVEGAKPGSDDFLCWTIVGISKFEYSYFESLPSSSSPRRDEAPVSHAITPFPTLLKEPVYNAVSQALELSVSNFYSLDNKPMQIWLGSVGPLTTHIIRSHLSSPAQDQTTVLVDLPGGQASHIGINKATPLLFVRPLDGITYDSRAKVTFHGPEETDRWTVQML
ncbi:hypothetical protein BGZ82_008309 [Podila clonocystis]|nr:hypothetical protein BGZ82_008309 [Podila clonocystis]